MNPPRQGLYDPRHEHDSCGVAFVVDIEGRRSHEVVRRGLAAVCRLDHRGARGAEPNTGDGAGVTIGIQPSSATTNRSSRIASITQKRPAAIAASTDATRSSRSRAAVAPTATPAAMSGQAAR